MIETAVIKLKAMDEFLAERGYTHLIYISPNKQQALGNLQKDPIVLQYLTQYDLQATYILDRLQPLELTPDDVERIYYDAGVHLTQEGHQVWAGIIGRDLAAVVQD